MDFGPVLKRLDRICELLADCRRDWLTEHPRDQYRAGQLGESLKALWRAQREWSAETALASADVLERIAGDLQQAQEAIAAAGKAAASHTTELFA